MNNNPHTDAMREALEAARMKIRNWPIPSNVNEGHARYVAITSRDGLLNQIDAALSAPKTERDGITGETVKFWRDDALENAALIVLQYKADPAIAFDIRALKSTPAQPDAGRAALSAERAVSPLEGS